MLPGSQRKYSAGLRGFRLHRPGDAPVLGVSVGVGGGPERRAGLPDYDRLVKWLSSAYMLGSLLTGPMPGMLADRFGSYVPAYLLFLASLVCSMALIQGVYYKLGVGKRPSKS